MKKLVFAALIAVLGSHASFADDVVDAFPFPLVTVNGANAFDTWQALRSKPGTPIILGPREEVESILYAFEPENADYFDPVEVSLEKAAALQHPESLYEYRQTEHAQFVESLQESGSDWAEEMAVVDPLEIPDDYWGPWPKLDPQPEGLISLDAWDTGQPYETVYITILPTENAWEAPLYLRFGGWNANPMPEIHAAAFRQWADGFGAVPVVMQSDVIEIYVERRPPTRDAARALAREQFLYCADIVDQGVGDMSMLAALLHKGSFWYFWWD